MIVPQYWAEARQQHRAAGKQVTVRRFGWSDASEAEAQVHAEQRAKDALAQVLAGVALARRERKRPYNGSEGVPIREEIVSRHGNAVITRNGYGALCLNTPDVFFADIDFDEPTAGRLAWVVFALGALLAVGISLWMRAAWVAIVLCILVAVLSAPIARFIKARLLAAEGGAEALALQRIDAFMAAHVDWGARLYRTPAGLRLLATHRTFDPRDPAVEQHLVALGADPVFIRMCVRQNCFRARVSPKPWRIGIGTHLRPRPGVWPIKPDKLPLRQRWVEAYEKAAASHGACRFVKTIGTPMIHVDVMATQRLHDEQCRADSALPIA
jgi:hypothetical protein